MGFQDEFARDILGCLGNVRNFQEFLGILKRPATLGIVEIFRNFVESSGLSWRVFESLWIFYIIVIIIHYYPWYRFRTVRDLWDALEI